jgi:hypothetical protein
VNAVPRFRLGADALQGGQEFGVRVYAACDEWGSIACENVYLCHGDAVLIVDEEPISDQP